MSKPRVPRRLLCRDDEGTRRPDEAKRARNSSARPRPFDPGFWTVENELPEFMPVSTAELDAIERYFGQVLDAVFDERSSKTSLLLKATSKGPNS